MHDHIKSEWVDYESRVHARNGLNVRRVYSRVWIKRQLYCHCYRDDKRHRDSLVQCSRSPDLAVGSKLRASWLPGCRFRLELSWYNMSPDGCRLIESVRFSVVLSFWRHTVRGVHGCIRCVRKLYCDGADERGFR